MARLFALTRTLRSQSLSGTLSGTQSWTVPAGVTNIVKMVGKGQDGSAYQWQTQTLTMAESLKSAVGSGANGLVLRSDLQQYGQSQADLFFTGTHIREVTYTPRTYITNSADDTAISTNASQTKTVRSSGTISSAGGGGLSDYFTYANAGADYVRVSIQVNIGGSNGADTVALGRTFWGGTGGDAVEITYFNTAVVPGAVHTFQIPVGGYLQLYYY